MDVPAQFISRVAERRAALRYALRLGDAVGAARAASRLLVVADALDPITTERIRDARTRLGRGLRLARRRRALGPLPVTSVASAPVFVRPGSTLRRWALVATLGIIAVLLIQLLPQATAGAPEGGGGSIAAPDQLVTNLALRRRHRTHLRPRALRSWRSRVRDHPAPVHRADPAPVGLVQVRAADRAAAVGADRAPALDPEQLPHSPLRPRHLEHSTRPTAVSQSWSSTPLRALRFPEFASWSARSIAGLQRLTPTRTVAGQWISRLAHRRPYGTCVSSTHGMFRITGAWFCGKTRPSPTEWHSSRTRPD